MLDLRTVHLMVTRRMRRGVRTVHYYYYYDRLLVYSSLMVGCMEQTNLVVVTY